MSFQERFKSKFSAMGKHGELDIRPERVVNKPLKSQIHSPAMRNLRLLSLDPSPTTTPDHKPVSLQNIAVSFRKIDGQTKAGGYPQPYSSESLHKPKSVSFTPYSLKDYYLIKPRKYYVLGGVGPASIGTEQWNNKKKIIEKREKYGFDANVGNTRKVYKSTEFYSNRYDEIVSSQKHGKHSSILYDDY